VVMAPRPMCLVRSSSWAISNRLYFRVDMDRGGSGQVAPAQLDDGQGGW